MRSFKGDGVIGVAIFWGTLWALLHFFFVDNGWIDSCHDFCIQLKDSALGKLLKRPWWLTLILMFNIVVWVIVVFMCFRMWREEKKEKSS